MRRARCDAIAQDGVPESRRPSNRVWQTDFAELETPAGGNAIVVGLPGLLCYSADAVAFLVWDGGEFARGHERRCSC